MFQLEMPASRARPVAPAVCSARATPKLPQSQAPPSAGNMKMAGDNRGRPEVIWSSLNSKEARYEHHHQPYDYEAICRLPEPPQDQSYSYQH